MAPFFFSPTAYAVEGVSDGHDHGNGAGITPFNEVDPAYGSGTARLMQYLAGWDVTMN